jgi:hypothetical protein
MTRERVARAETDANLADMQLRLSWLFCVAMFPLVGTLACGSRDLDVVDGGVSDGGTCGCIGQSVEWGMSGGFVPSQEVSTLGACATFGHRLAAKPPAPSCEQPLGECAAAIGARDVARAIANADVQAAIAAAPVIYGQDSRAVDGQVLRMQIGAAIVEVGSPCGSASCKPIPNGVGDLATLLQALTKQELARAPCKTSFPQP